MRKVFIFLVFFVFATLVSVFSVESEPITLLISELNRTRSFSTDVSVNFHIFDEKAATPSYFDFSFAFKFETNENSDWLISVTGPEELAGIEFVYLEKEEILFSVIDGNPWKQYRTKDDLYVLGGFLSTFFKGLLDERNFSWVKEKKEDLYLYKLEPNEAKLRFLGLIGGGGYIPNIMSLELALEGKEGRFPIPLYLKISDRLKRESVTITFKTFDFETHTGIFENLRKIYYQSFGD